MPESLTETLNVTKTFRDATLDSQGNVRVARTVEYSKNGVIRFTDVEYEDVPAGNPLPADLLSLVDNRVAKR